MIRQDLWKQLIDIMEQERKLLNDIIEESTEMRTTLHEKNWSTLEVSLKKIDGLADLIEIIEAKRHLTTEKLSSRKKSLKKQISELPQKLRKEFQTTRTELRASLLLVRSRIRGVSGYARSRGRLGRELMEELVPSTRGRIYNKQGHSASTGRDPIIVSRHL